MRPVLLSALAWCGGLGLGVAVDPFAPLAGVIGWRETHHLTLRLAGSVALAVISAPLTGEALLPTVGRFALITLLCALLDTRWIDLRLRLVAAAVVGSAIAGMALELSGSPAAVLTLPMVVYITTYAHLVRASGPASVPRPRFARQPTAPLGLPAVRLSR